MRVFTEKQRFNQWWLYSIFMVVLAVLLLGIYENTDGFTNLSDPSHILIPLAATLVMGLILWMKLETRIDNEGVWVKFAPFAISAKFFPWGEIDKCFVREYNPLIEFGGWGIRGFHSKKAYNVSGNLGIQIVTRDRKSFLIGTRKPDLAQTVIKYNEHRINSQPNKY